MKTKKAFVRVAVVALALTAAVLVWLWRLNPLRKYGVHLEWSYSPDAATSSVPSLFVWWEDGARRINAPNIFGGVVDPSLSFTDVDGDGIPDIVFSDSEGLRRVIAFHPATAGREPCFVILENSIPGD
ncbi:MAG: hypothetical protein ABI318_23285 [Chthoniobacteraceae bacterium]